MAKSAGGLKFVAIFNPVNNVGDGILFQYKSPLEFIMEVGKDICDIDGSVLGRIVDVYETANMGERRITVECVSQDVFNSLVERSMIVD